MPTDILINLEVIKKKSRREKKMELRVYYSRPSYKILYSLILTNILRHDMIPGYPDYKLDTRV